ncbi:hypothetical protein AB0933_32805 [Streptomyces venezuelae]|uniref:hypothetical protein n=1 Tax=Streptomyces venezuelae TaxID=54571 RepID=UPI003452D601
MTDPSAPDPYRRLLAHLEAGRAAQLQGARTAEAMGEDGHELLHVASGMAAAFLHAATMAVREFEGPEAAQAYAQRLTDREAADSADPAERIST